MYERPFGGRADCLRFIWAADRWSNYILWNKFYFNRFLDCYELFVTQLSDYTDSPRLSGIVVVYITKFLSRSVYYTIDFFLVKLSNNARIFNMYKAHCIV